jgi:hypothetical protein
MYSNDEKTDMILIFGECRKNAVQPAHVTLKDIQIGLFLTFLSNVDFIQYFFV